MDAENCTRFTTHLLEIRNRSDKNPNSTSNTLRFKSLTVDNLYDLHTISYQYDALARVIDARYFSGHNIGGTAFRTYAYGFDVAGNRTSETINGVTTNTSYNAANQVSTFTYDPNGNLTNDGTNTYTWDRTNRLLSMGGSSYKYDGLGNRVQQTVSSVITKYLLDLQPGLVNVLAATEGSATTHYVHGPRGIHAEHNSDNTWEWMLQDGLGSVRGVVDNSSNIAGFRHFEPYGEAFSTVGTVPTMYNFTGEPLDGNGLLHLRARYYNPNLGVFTALDPWEGNLKNPISLNRFAYTSGNPINLVDHSGLQEAYPIAPIIDPSRAEKLAAEFIESYIKFLDETGQKTTACAVTGTAVTVDGPAVEIACLGWGTALVAVSSIAAAMYISFLWQSAIPYSGPTEADVDNSAPTPNPNATTVGQTATLPPTNKVCPVPTRVPDSKEIIVDLGPSDNLAEIDLLMLRAKSSHPSRKLVLIESNAADTVTALMNNGRIPFDPQTFANMQTVESGVLYSDDNIEVIKGTFNNSTILSNRQAEELFSIYPNFGAAGILGPTALLHLKQNGSMYTLIDTAPIYRAAEQSLNGVINFRDPLRGHFTTDRGIQFNRRGAGVGIQFFSPGFGGDIVYEIWGPRI